MRMLKNKKGFTFVEMLVCVITLLMVGAICATGTGISVKSYQQSRFETDSQMLESTLDMALGDLLRFATNANADGTNVRFTNHYYQMEQGSVIVDENGHLIIKKNPHQDKTLALIGNKAYAEDLQITEFELGYDEGSKLFSGSYTIKSKAMPSDPGKVCTFTYRTIAE